MSAKSVVNTAPRLRVWKPLLTSELTPVIAGFVLLAVIFQSANSNFLTAGNIINLFVQGSVYVILALGVTFVLIMREIDLSIGFVAGVGAAVMTVTMFGANGLPWWVSVGLGLIVPVAIGFTQGAIVAFVALPSFVVTLGGLLAWNGVMLIILGEGATIPIQSDMVNGIGNGMIPVALSWILLLCGLVVFWIVKIIDMRADGTETDGRAKLIKFLTAPLVLTLIGFAFVGLASIDRGRLAEVRGVPVIVAVMIVATIVVDLVLTQTRFGVAIYAIGGNPEAARRAGINIKATMIAAFCATGLLAGIGGIAYAARLRSMSSNLDGGTLVLYTIAAAVIGGTSLFGGRGKAVNAVLGGLLIAAVDNGLGLLGVSAAGRMIATGSILVAAVSVDALARRSRARAGIAE